MDDGGGDLPESYDAFGFGKPNGASKYEFHNCRAAVIFWCC